MVLPAGARSRKKQSTVRATQGGLLLLVLGLLWIGFASPQSPYGYVYSSEYMHIVQDPNTTTVISSSALDHQACTDLAETSIAEAKRLLRPAKRNDVSTSPLLDTQIQPPFHFASVYPANRAVYHLYGDVANFYLIAQLRRLSSNSNDMLAFDVGANQGFYTYYLATLGFEVHAFEINQKNCVSLQHGQLFNPKDVSDRVHLYKLGLSNKVEYMTISGVGYKGFLKSADDAEADSRNTILSVPFDCMSQRLNLDLSKGVGFVKIDVEGFEIAVLQGAQQLLLGTRIGGLLAEIGPNRWERAGVTTNQGVEALERLASKFQYSYIMIRHDRQCPDNLVEEGIIADHENAITILSTKLYKISQSEWSNLISKMNDMDSDCNFWFAQQEPQPSAGEVP